MSSFNPFGLVVPLVGCVEKVAKCAKCGYKPETWNGEPNVSRLTDIPRNGYHSFHIHALSGSNGSNVTNRVMLASVTLLHETPKSSLL